MSSLFSAVCPSYLVQVTREVNGKKFKRCGKFFLFSRHFRLRQSNFINSHIFIVLRTCPIDRNMQACRRMNFLSKTTAFNYFYGFLLVLLKFVATIYIVLSSHMWFTYQMYVCWIQFERKLKGRKFHSRITIVSGAVSLSVGGLWRAQEARSKSKRTKVEHKILLPYLIWSLKLRPWNNNIDKWAAYRTSAAVLQPC
jgi:hypothetical protein